MKRIKIILSYLLGFILSVSISVLGLLIIFKYTVFNKSYVKDLLVKNNYYESIYNYINEGISDYMVSSGLPESVIDGTFTKDDVERDVKLFIDSMYEGKRVDIDTTRLKDKLRNNINVYIKSLNLGIDNTDELDLFISDTAQIYTNEVKLYNMVDGFSHKFSEFGNIVDKAIIIDGVIDIILIIILIIFGTLNIGSSVMSSGIILILIRLFIFDRIDSKNILIFSESFSVIVKKILGNISLFMLISGISLIIVGFIVSLLKKRR